MRRTYVSAARAEAARQTRRRILAAAHELLVRDGYVGLSMSTLAEAAEVSPQTIYNAVGPKSAVLKACYDVTLAGDDEPVAMSDRPGMRAVQEAPTPAAYAAAYAAWCREIYDHTGSLLGAVLRPGEVADAGAAEFVATIEKERRIGTGHAMAAYEKRFGLPRSLTLERAIDAVWTLNSPEVYDRLVRRCGWSADEYEAWLTGQMKAALRMGSAV